MTFRRRPKTARERFGYAHVGEYPQTVIDYGDPERIGCVYFVQCEGFVKIGFSSNPRGRLGGMTTGNPFEMKLLFVVKKVPFSRERHYHDMFRECRHRDEWFRLEGRLKSFLEAQKL